MESKIYQSKNWIFTLNSKKEEESKLPHPEFFLESITKDDVLTIQFQAEEGSNLHFQGFLTLRKKITKFGLLKLFNEFNWVYVAPMRGNIGDNLQYTSKSDTRIAGPWHYACGHPGYIGPLPPEPASDSKPTSKRSRSGFPVRSQIPSDPEGLQTDGRSVVVCCGPPGVGKTRIWNLILGYAYGPHGIYSIPARAGQSTARWISEYSGEPSVVIDEFSYSDFAPNQWKMMLDRYDIRLPCKMGGKSCLWQPQIVVLLTNVSFDSIKRVFLENEALRRRLSIVWDWSKVPISPLVSGPSVHAF